MNAPVKIDLPIRFVDDEPRILDTDLAERLGFSAPRQIRETIKANAEELRGFGDVVDRVDDVPMPRGGFKQTTAYYLNEEQTLLLCLLSKTDRAKAVRAEVIRTYTAYRRGALATLGSDTRPVELDAETRRTIGGIMKAVVHKELVDILPRIVPPIVEQCLATMLPAMVAGYIGQSTAVLRRGVTAGQLLAANGYPRMRGLAVWTGNRMKELGFALEGDARGELGLSRARLFDPDKAEKWIRNGGAVAIKMKVAERKGQGRLTLV